MANVLCTGIQPGLVQTRKLILEQAGHRVVTAISDSEVIAACRSVKFDVAVIGQTEQAKAKEDWKNLVRQFCPSARILEVFVPSLGMALNDADDWLSSPAEPLQLSLRVSTLAANNRKAANQ